MASVLSSGQLLQGLCHTGGGGTTKQGVGILSGSCEHLFLNMSCIFFLIFLYWCYRGQKHRSVCRRNRWSDTLWCHAGLCQSLRLISSHFRRLSSRANVLLIFCTRGPRLQNGAAKCPAGSVHTAQGLQLILGRAGEVSSSCPSCAVQMPGLLSSQLCSCCSWRCSALKRAVTYFCQMI